MMNETTKHILFWILTLLIPFFLIGLVELGLRAGGYEQSKQELFSEAPKTPEYLLANPGFIERYFPSFVPEVAPNTFRKQKRPNTFRVFVFGGSSAEGFPYNFYTGFADQLEQTLLLNTQGLTIEVINLGMTAVNSFVIRDLSKRVLPYEPDAVIVYAGHNEYYGSFGAATTQFGFTDSIRIKHLILWLKNWRFYQALENLLRGRGEANPEQRTMMAKVIRESDIPAGGDVYEQGIRAFEANMADVIDTFTRRGIPVYIGTLGSNLKDQPPLSDDPLAVSAYERGLALLEQQALDDARRAFEEAKERDGIRFRAPNRINEQIEAFGGIPGVDVVDIQRVLSENAQSGIEDRSLFIDHLHPNDVGHKLMAASFFEALSGHPGLQGALLANPVRPPQAISRFENAYAEVSIARLLAGYPFEKNRSVREELDAFEEAYQSVLQTSYIDSIAAVASKEQVFVPLALTQVIASARERNDTMAVVTHSYDLLKWQLRSINLIESSIEFTLNSGEQEGYLINLLHQVLNDGNYDPRYVDLLSSLYLLQENTDHAAYWLRETERLTPGAPRLLYNYSRYHLLTGDTLQAQAYFQRFLQTQNPQP